MLCAAIADRTAGELTGAVLQRPFFTTQPEPDKGTCCGPPPLSLMETWALSLPASLGLKVTVMVQDFPAPTLEPQVLV